MVLVTSVAQELVLHRVDRAAKERKYCLMYSTMSGYDFGDYGNEYREPAGAWKQRAWSTKCLAGRGTSSFSGCLGGLETPSPAEEDLSDLQPLAKDIWQAARALVVV